MLEEMLEDTGLAFPVSLLDYCQQFTLSVFGVDGMAEFHRLR